AAQLVTAAQSLVSRETDPLDQAVISFTSIHGGTASNIIPESVELLGTLRTFRAETRAYLKERLRSFAEGLAASQRGGARMSWTDESPAVVNDEALCGRMKKVAEGVVGSERVLVSAPIMGGDDMALWLQEAPGCYFFVGARNEAAGIDKPHHHPQFDIDEASLSIAVEALSKGILEFLR
ncbi:MAG TPA: M20/M25/M40 family metallo-hydrolase, partial [Trueperaceae bacterium]